MNTSVSVTDLLRDHPVIDGHNDLLWALRERHGYDFDEVDIAERQDGRVHTDLPRLRAGGVGAQFWSVYVPSTMGPDAVGATLEQIDAAYRMIERYADRMAMATTADEVEAAWASGRVASLLGAEGGHQIDGSLAVLRMYHRLGVRYLTLTHNENVAWADSATDERVLGGLNDVGRGVVAEMNRLGMMVDLSHVSAETMRDALDVSTAPVIFSHSSAYALTDHPRNVPDDVLERTADGGGVCMVSFVPRFVSQANRDWALAAEDGARMAGIDPKVLAAFEPFIVDARSAGSRLPPATLDDVVAHVEHVARGGRGRPRRARRRLRRRHLAARGTGGRQLLPAVDRGARRRGWSAEDLGKLTCRNALPGAAGRGGRGGLTAGRSGWRRSLRWAAERDRERRVPGGQTSTMTLVDLITAVACLPTSRPSSSAASRLISDTTRNSPHTISTWAITRSLVMPTTTPCIRLRALETRSDPLTEAVSAASLSARSTRWLPRRSNWMVPLASQRRSVSTLTPTAWATSPMRKYSATSRS